jgi:hypothetical protein
MGTRHEKHSVLETGVVHGTIPTQLETWKCDQVAHEK